MGVNFANFKINVNVNSKHRHVNRKKRKKVFFPKKIALKKRPKML
jgi:hypothetical protein